MICLELALFKVLFIFLSLKRSKLFLKTPIPNKAFKPSSLSNGKTQKVSDFKEKT